MSPASASRTLALIALLALVPAACSGSGNAGGVNPGATGLGGGILPTFTGVASADAISPTEALVSWPDAIGGSANSSATMVYRVYRAFDQASVLLPSALIHETDPGVTSYIDTGLPPFTTVFYRVEAVDSLGNVATNEVITSARTPSVYAPGTIDYDTNVLPLWSTADPAGNTCIGCHDGQSGLGGRLDLSTAESVLIGVGTPSAPDSFVIAYDGEGTWNEFVARFILRPLEHGGYFTSPAGVLAIQQPLSDWVDQGALAQPDGDPPVFEFDNIANAGKYWGQFLDYQTVEVTWFHASDPESLPFTGNTAGQLEYHVYAGATSADIDWENPVAVVMSPEKTPQNDTITTTFTWTGDQVHIVVRAMDAAGRSVVLPDPGDPGYRDALMARWRNMSVNEREIVLVR
ncbi:MAG: hypothetical protein D6702_05245 [Planctomycetota bacterium]|nr:MAG: hypothetical protein D6702_05245 [Planctomycetota bacterium]